jgi:Mg-chelatase subunit ChlD
MRISIAVAVLAALGLPAPSAAAPMRVALLVDTSASTSTALPQIREGLVAFLDALPAEHEVLLVTTGRRAQVRIQPTQDRARLKASAKGLLSDNGPTPLIDALREIDQRFMRKAADRVPVFVIVTGDGSESSSETDDKTFRQWVTDIGGRGVSVSAVVLKTSGSGIPEAVARSLVDATGGHYTVMSNGSGFPAALVKLAGELAADAKSR